MSHTLKAASIWWGILVTAAFAASFISEVAATFAIFTRYIYMIVLAGCAVGVALGLMRQVD